MDEQTTSSQLETIPARLFFSALPNGALEFSCFVQLLGQNASPVARSEITWSVADTASTPSALTASRSTTDEEQAAGRLFLSAILPPGWAIAACVLPCSPAHTRRSANGRSRATSRPPSSPFPSAARSWR